MSSPPLPPPPPIPAPPPVLGAPPPPPPHPPVPHSPGFWWRVLSPVGSVIAAFAALMAVGGVAFALAGDAHEDAVGTLVVFAGSLMLLVLGAVLMERLPRHERRIAMGIKHTPRGAVLMGINVGIGLLIAQVAIIALGMLVDPSLEDRLKDTATDLGPGAWGIALSVVALVVLAPLGEEILFRGLLLRALTRRLPFPWAAGISAVVFACAHLDAWVNLFWPRLIALTAVGVGLAWLYRWRGYWAAVAAHATVNLAAAVALIAQS